MGTKLQTIFMTLVYSGLAICLTGLLATALVESFPHQVFGIAFFVLVLCHLALNRFWLRHSLAGSWDARRVFLAVLDAALIILSLVQIVNCILLSSFFWSLLPTTFAYFSSSFHMCVGTWLFFLAAVHMGVNAGAAIKNKLSFRHAARQSEALNVRRVLVNALVALVWFALVVVGIYGAIEFFELQMPQFMVMAANTQVAPDEALVVRFLQYLCVGVAIAGITHWFSVLARAMSLKGTRDHSRHHEA